MGRNIDMIKMFGNFKITCPHCGNVVMASETYLDDIDVDDSDFNPENGIWQVAMWCYGKCDQKFPLRLKITAEQEIDHSSARRVI